MPTIEDVEELKAIAEQRRQEADRAEGELEGLRKRLKKEFECDSIEEAEKLLEEFQEKEAKAKKDFEVSYIDFQEKWESTLTE